MHGHAVEPRTRERSAGVDGALPSTQLAQSKGAARVGLQHGELSTVGGDAGLREGGQARHIMVGADAEGQRQQAVLQCGRATGAAVLRAAAEAGPTGDTDMLVGLPSSTAQSIPKCTPNTLPTDATVSSFQILAN